MSAAGMEDGMERLVRSKSVFTHWNDPVAVEVRAKSTQNFRPNDVNDNEFVEGTFHSSRSP